MRHEGRRPLFAAALAAIFPLAVAIAAVGQTPPAAPPPAVESPNVCLASAGSRSWCGDERPATMAKLAAPSDVATAPDGSLLVADTLNNVIRRVRRDGTIVSIAGTGFEGSTPRRRAAKMTRFAGPAGVAAAGGGGVLVADTGNDLVRSVSASGTVTTLVSAEGPARAALEAPGDVAPHPAGGMLVADTGNHRVLHVSGKSVTVLAGTGREGYSGDGAPATAATLRRPSQVAVAGDGSVLIADTGNRAIRRVLPSGAIETLTGGLTEPRGVLPLPDGTVVVTSAAGVHRVVPGGTRERIAGGAGRGFNGDHRTALTARFDGVGQLAAAADGRILFAERASDRIRAFTPGGDVATLAGSGVPVHEAAPEIPVGTPPPELFRRSMARTASTAACLGYHSRFATFSLVPIIRDPLRPKRRRRIRMRFDTSKPADVVIELFRKGTRVGVKTKRGVSEGRRRIRVRGRRKKRRYVAKLWGISLDERVVRCDVKRVRVR